MNCHRCDRPLENRTVCPDCRIPVRPRSLLAASVVSLMVAILLLSMQNVILALVSGAVGFFLLRVSRYAIAIAVVLSSIGLLVSAFLIATGGGAPLLTAEGREQVDPGSVLIRSAGLAILYLVMLISLLRPESRWAYRVAGMDPEALNAVIAREGNLR